MSFYQCEQCEKQYGYSEKPPIFINIYEGDLFCCMDCLLKYWSKNWTKKR